MRGRWRYLEHEWIAEPGSYIFEPPGETHTLCVSDDGGEMITLFHVTAGYTYLDPDGAITGFEDVFTKIDAVRRFHAKLGLGPEHLDRLVI